MKIINITDVVNATGGILKSRAADDYTVTGISTDSRLVSIGNIFFALSGERFDGHDYLDSVAQSGAVAVVVEDTAQVPHDYDGAVLVVPDTLRAYQDLAHYYLKMIHPKVIAITGSVGKTSIKDMMQVAMSAKYKTSYTMGNFNNGIGLPKTIFDMDDDAQVLVLEMGMSAPGEIRRLVEIANPDIAVIGNIGISHRENFETDDGIFQAKMEIISAFQDGTTKDGVLIVNADDSKLGALRQEDLPCKLIRVGSGKADIAVHDVTYDEKDGLHFKLDINQAKQDAVPDIDFQIPVAGTYNAVNAGIAVAAGDVLDINVKDIARALTSINRTKHRLDLVERNGIKVIDDTYNASPTSMKSGIDHLVAITGTRHIAVLSDMLELGPESKNGHLEVGRYAAEKGLDLIIAVGEKSKDIYAGAFAASPDAPDVPDTLVKHFADKLEAARFLDTYVKEGDVYLLKGSRSTHMEELIDAILS
ncbi:MAG: UDP-N-acetylmuramoyl-tripeptide--D-alanyl-D-alanine ligase [Clostridiales Family XIII bacterium]|jgi:UDP-N-acetylmuramoyl-tripeptide--D-alanyl-D-alanine ligase|nr:UDP-N-acetylmuramoyl-tripeptide--D-alanyl-D-alanine ligase [Clostridiales Family XIII bacterium]